MAKPDPHILLIGGDGGYSGVPTYLEQMAQALAGHARLTIASDTNTGGYDFAADMDHVSHVTVEGLKSGLNPRAHARARQALAALIARARPDLVWPHARMGVHLARNLARHPGFPPLAVTYHGLPFGPGHRPWLAALSLQTERWFLRRLPPHHLIFLSAAARDNFARSVGTNRVARHTAHVLENCSSLGPVPRTAQPGRPERMLVMTGRASYQKNLPAAARLMAGLPEMYHLTLCGHGTDTEAMRREFARHLGAAATATRIRFVGPVADVRPYLAEADAFLLTSRYEGMPIAALEAFEAGLPMILSDIPGTAEIRDTHPICVTLNLSNPHAAIPAIQTQTATFLDSVDEAQAAIQQAWKTRFSREVWEVGVRGILKGLIG